MTSVERLHHYISHIPHEGETIARLDGGSGDGGVVVDPQDWPINGDVKVRV